MEADFSSCFNAFLLGKLQDASVQKTKRLEEAFLLKFFSLFFNYPKGVKTIF